MLFPPALNPLNFSDTRKGDHVHVFAGDEDVLCQFHVIQHESKAQGFRVTLEFAEDAEGTPEEGSIFRLRNIVNTASKREREKTMKSG